MPTSNSGAFLRKSQLGEVDDVPFFDPYEIWKLQFYRNAIKVSSWAQSYRCKKKANDEETMGNIDVENP